MVRYSVLENEINLGERHEMVLDAIIGVPKRRQKVMFDIYINCNKIQTAPYFQPERIPANFYAKSTLNRIDFSNLESISINESFILPPYTGDFADFLESADWPIIQLNTINDIIMYKPVFDMKFYHASYQNYTKEFYAPVYETEKQKKDPVPDLRTTIFWQANVFTDENGQARINFYNADRSKSNWYYCGRCRCLQQDGICTDRLQGIGGTFD